MYIALAISSIFLFVTYLVSSIILYNKKEGQKFNLKNYFAYELWNDKNHQGFALNILLLLALGLYFANYVTLTINVYSVANLLRAIICLIATFSIGVIHVLPLNKLREHLIFDVFSIALVAGLSISNLISELELFNIERNYLFLLPIIIDTLVLITCVIALFYPRLFNLNMDRDENNNLMRPNFIPLALFEWLITFGLFLLQISIVITSII